MTHIVHGVMTKQGLITRIANEDIGGILLESPDDPNEMLPLRDMAVGRALSITNRPRTWFAKIYRRFDGSFRVS